MVCCENKLRKLVGKLNIEQNKPAERLENFFIVGLPRRTCQLASLDLDSLKFSVHLLKQNVFVVFTKQLREFRRLID